MRKNLPDPSAGDAKTRRGPELQVVKRPAVQSDSNLDKSVQLRAERNFAFVDFADRAARSELVRRQPDLAYDRRGARARLIVNRACGAASLSCPCSGTCGII